MLTRGSSTSQATKHETQHPKFKCYTFVKPLKDHKNATEVACIKTKPRHTLLFLQTNINRNVKQRQHRFTRLKIRMHKFL